MNIPDMRLGAQEATRFQAVQAILGDFIARRAGDRLRSAAVRHARLPAHAPDLVSDRAHPAGREAAVGLGRETAIGDAIGLVVKRLR